MDLLMTDYIGDELAPKIIRVTKGADRKFTIRRKDTNGDPVDWDADVYLSIDIDKTAPTRIDADVTDDLAVLRIESTVVALLKDSTTWQAIMSQAGVPTLETPLMVGTFERQDGKSA
jgi:hypothetical protein